MIQIGGEMQAPNAWPLGTEQNQLMFHIRLNWVQLNAKKKMVQWPIGPKINEGDQYIGVGQWAEISKALSCLVL